MRKFDPVVFWVKLNFTRHEIWVLTVARRFPPFALFAMGTLFVWGFVPAILIAPLSLALMAPISLVLGSYAFIVWAIVSFVIGMPILFFLVVILSPWYFRWYFVCAGLFLGRKKMAQKKEDDLNKRLARLTGLST